MKILISGGAGFIGSAVCRSAIGAGHSVLTFDKLTYAGRIAALAEVLDSPLHRFQKADITDMEAVASAFKEFNPDVVLHLAAESHVDRSIDEPGVFVSTNVVGTFVLLEAATSYWLRLSAEKRDQFRFIHVSTDEVFGTLQESGTFTIDSRYAPNSPYAASKAAGDHLARAWHHTYGLPVVITNCSNNYGPWQHSEKLIPTVIRHALGGAPIPLYGDGTNRRDWLYVDDHVKAIFAAIHYGRPGATYLFGGRCEVSNLDLTKMICSLLDERRPRADGKPYCQQVTFVSDRPGHDFRYAIDPSFAERELQWRPQEQLSGGLARTVDWYLANPASLAPVDELGRLGVRRSSELARAAP